MVGFDLSWQSQPPACFIFTVASCSTRLDFILDAFVTCVLVDVAPRSSTDLTNFSGVNLLPVQSRRSGCWRLCFQRRGAVKPSYPRSILGAFIRTCLGVRSLHVQCFPVWFPWRKYFIAELTWMHHRPNKGHS